MGSERASKPKHSTWLWGVAVLLLVGGILRAWHLGSQSLWVDEARFLEAALQPDIASVVRFVAVQDYHPPLYPLALRAWIAVFGTSDVSVRVLPALAGLAVIPLTAWLTLLLSGRRWASLAAALLVATGGYHLYLSQEGRHYTWLAAVGCLNIIALVEFLRSGRRRHLFVLGLTTLMGALSHYYMLLLTVGEVLFSAWVPRRRRSGLVLALGGSLVVFAVVWAKPLVEQGLQRATWGEGLLDPVVGPRRAIVFVTQSLYWIVVDFSLGRPILLLGGQGFDWPDVFKFFAVAAITGLGVAGLLAMRTRRAALSFSPVAAIATLGGLPIALAIMSSFTQALIFDTKYVSFAAPLWAAAVGTGLAAAGRRFVAKALLGVAVAALCAAALEFHLEAIPWKEDWRGAADLIRGRWRPGDVVLQRASYTAFCLDHYLGWTPNRLTSPGVFVDPEESVRPVLNEIRARNAKRLWVVTSHDERGAMLRELLASRMVRGPTWPLRGITIALYQMPPTPQP